MIVQVKLTQSLAEQQQGKADVACYHLLAQHRLVLNGIEKGCEEGEKKTVIAALQY